MKADRRLARYLYLGELRLRLVDSVVWVSWGAAAGLVEALALALAARAVPLVMTSQLVLLAALSTLVGGALALAAAWIRPRSRHKIARLLDRRLALAERLTTALEIESGQLLTSAAMGSAQLADTLKVAGRVNLRAGLPLKTPRTALLLFAGLAAGLALSLWLPNPQETVLLRQASLRAAVEEQIENLEVARQEIAGAEGLTQAERELLLEALEEAIDGLDEGAATPEEAVQALAQAERALAELQDPGAADVRTGLERAGDAMADSELTSPIAEALARGDYTRAAEALATYAGTRGEPLTRDEELELARQLAEAAQAARSDPDLAEQLTEAAGAIERGDIARAREAIREAARQLSQAGARVAREETVEETLAALQQGREEIAQAVGTGSGSGEPLGQGGTGGQAGQGGQQAGAGQQTQPGHHEDAGTGAPYDEVYVPSRLEDEGVAVDVGREGDLGLPAGDTPLPPPAEAQASVPYDEVYAEYSSQAHAALQGSYVPLGMRQYVRDYFSSLEP